MEDFDFQWAIDVVNSILPGGKVRVLAYDYGNSAGIAWEVPEGRRFSTRLKWIEFIGGLSEYDDDGNLIKYEPPEETIHHRMTREELKEVVLKSLEKQEKAA